MGFFGAYLYASGRWTRYTELRELDLDQTRFGELSEPWLSLVLHDSYFGVLRYSPRGEGTGEAYIGRKPRMYSEWFADGGVSTPTEVSREARGLAGWAEAALPGAAVVAESLRSFLASDDAVDEGNEEGPDDSEVSVEVKSARFLVALGLPLPADLSTDDM